MAAQERKMYVGTPTVSLLVGVRQSGQMQDDLHPAQICNWTAGATAARASLLWPLPMCMGGVVGCVAMQLDCW